MPRAFLLLSFILLLACGGGGGDGGGGGNGAPEPETGFRITTTNLPPGQAGQAYGATLEATGGTDAGHTWRIVAGALPAGVSLDGGPSCLAWGAFSQVGTITPDGGTGALTEISGLAASRRNPGILWAHDDSGGEAVLYALGEDGTLRQSYTLTATPFDWEDIALGPGPDSEKEYLYVGDVGDNSKARAHVTLLRVEEPAVPASASPAIPLPHDAFTLSYPDAAHDVEALLADWRTGALYVLEKDEAGGDVFRTPLPLDPAWTSTTPGTFIRVTSGRPLPANVTAADAGRDGYRVLLRTYLGGFELVPQPGASFDELFTETPCSFTVPFLGQYESLALAPDGTAIYTTTELFVGTTVPLFRGDAATNAPSASLGGTPAATGTWTFTVEVRDSAGAIATQELVLDVR